VAIAKTSEPYHLPVPASVVFDALLAGAREVLLHVTWVDPQRGIVWADRPMSLWSAGEKVTIFVRPDGPEGSIVVVESRLTYGLIGWGVHKKNFELVYDAIDTGLASGYPPEL
jgi:hypothetical protein